MEYPEPHKIYFDTLAERLREIDDISQQEDKFKMFTKTLAYTLAEHKRLRAGKENSPKESPDSHLHEAGCQCSICGNLYFTSNEPALYKLFGVLKKKRGVCIGVGPDQILDMIVNSNLDEIYLVDISDHTHITSKLFLEILCLHEDIHGKAPRKEEVLAYFSDPNLRPLVLSNLKESFTSQEFKIVQKVFRSGSLTFENVENLVNSPQILDDVDNLIEQSRLYIYLQNKAFQDTFKSWISSSETITKVLTAYKAGKIHLVNASITGDTAMKKIAEDLKDQGKKVSVIYLSNVPTYVAMEKELEKLMRNLDTLPTEKDTLVISTRSSYSPLDMADVPNYGKKVEDILVYGRWSYIVNTLDNIIQYGDASTIPINSFDKKTIDEMNLRKVEKGVYYATTIN